MTLVQAVGLLSFGLASAGAMFLLYRSKLSARRQRSLSRADLRQVGRELTVKRLLAAGTQDAVLLDSRDGVALVLAYRALATAAEECAGPAERLAKKARIAYRRSTVQGG